MSFLYDINIFSEIIKPLEKSAQANFDLNTRNLANKLVNNLDIDFNNNNNITANSDYELHSSDLKDINDFILFLFKNEIKFNNIQIVKQELDASEQDKQSRKLYEVDFNGQKYNVLIDVSAITGYLNHLTQIAQDSTDRVTLSLLNGLRSSLQGVINQDDVKAKDLEQHSILTDDMAISLVPTQYSETSTGGSTVLTVKDLKDQFSFNNWLEKNNIQVLGKELYSSLGTVMYWLNQKFNDLKTQAKSQLDLDKANLALNKITELAKTFGISTYNLLNKPNNNIYIPNKTDQTNQPISNQNNQQQSQNQYFNKAVNNLPFRPYSITLSKFRNFFDNLRQFDPAYNSLSTRALNSFSDAANLTTSNLDTFILNGGAASLYEKVDGRNSKEKLNNFYLMLEKLQEGIVLSKEIIDALYYKEEKPILDNKSLNNEFRLQVGKSPTDTSAFSDNMRLLRNIKSEVQKNISRVK